MTRPIPPDECPHTGQPVDVCLCMVHDPEGAHFRATRPGMNVLPPGTTDK